MNRNNVPRGKPEGDIQFVIVTDDPHRKLTSVEWMLIALLVVAIAAIVYAACLPSGS